MTTAERQTQHAELYRAAQMRARAWIAAYAPARIAAEEKGVRLAREARERLVRDFEEAGREALQGG